MRCVNRWPVKGKEFVGCMQSNPRRFSLFLQCSVVVRPVPDFSRCSGVPAKVRIGTLYARYLIEEGLTRVGLLSCEQATSLGSSDAVKQKMLEPGHRAYIYVFSESCYA